MYRLVLKNDIYSVNEVFWALNQNSFSSLYRTREWMIDSQKRLGDRDLYIECYYDNSPISLVPIIIFDERSTYTPVDPHSMVESSLKISQLHEPVAISITPFGLGCPILCKSTEIDWSILINQILKMLKERFNINYLVCSFLSKIDNPISIDKENNFNYALIPHKPYGIFNVKDYVDFEHYLHMIKSGARRAYFKETTIQQKCNVELDNVAINKYSYELLGKLASNVYRKYGSDVDYKRLSSFAEYVYNTFEKTGIFVCTKNEKILSYALFIEHDKVLHMKMLGRNYDEDNFSTYFSSSYYGPIQYAFSKGIDQINYGSGSIETKCARNINMFDSYSYVFY